MEEATDNSGRATTRSGTVSNQPAPALGEASGSASERFLEKNVPLSRSVIWQRQREFYSRRGLDVWTADKVPQFITNNPFIAEIYARIVFAFIRECIAQNGQEAAAALPQRAAVRILELGAGTGKFAYLFLKRLTGLMREHGIAPATVCYTMTDCSELLVASWRRNGYLGEFAGSGLLEFAKFGAGEDAINSLAAKDSPPGALVVVANYVLDSLPQDVFFIGGGQIEELLLTTAMPENPGGDSEQKDVPLSQLRLSFTQAPTTGSRYTDPVSGAALEEYRKRQARATVLFPAGALQLFESLRALSDGRMLVLAADKGYACEDALACSPGPPVFEWHAAECFSLMANFDAVAKFFRATGGDALLPEKHSSSLHICGFLRGRDGEHFPATRFAYRDAQAAFGPDDLFALLAWLNAHMEEIRLPQILATLRLTAWDPIALLRLFPVLARQLRNTRAEREDIRRAVLRAWDNHFPVAPGENALAFHCGVILLELGFFSDAERMFRSSKRVLGPSATTSYNLGLCAQGVGRKQDALAFMQESCTLDPSFEPARNARDRLKREEGESR